MDWLGDLPGLDSNMEDGNRACLAALLRSVGGINFPRTGKLNWLSALVCAFCPSLTPLYADESLCIPGYFA